MKLWAPIEELRASVNLAPLTVSEKDEELIGYARAAQNFAVKYCKRGFDGNSVGPAQFYNGDDSSSRIILKNYPIISVSSLYDDPGFEYASTSLISSSDYVVMPERGELFLKSGSFNEGLRNIKVTYQGGYISETVVVASALAANTMTIANNLSTFGQPFNLFVKIATAKNAGVVTITGTDEGGAAQTETLTVTQVSKAPILLNSRKLWKTVTQFDALPVRGDSSTGTIQLTGTSFPEDLRAAVSLHMAHLYFQDQNQSINPASRSSEGETESGYRAEVPKEVMQILNGYKDYQ